MTDATGLWYARYEKGLRIGVQHDALMFGVGVNGWSMSKTVNRFVANDKPIIETSTNFGWIGWTAGRPGA